MLARENLIPVAVFTAAALALLVASRRGKGLLALIACSYCGSIALTFTRGTMGSVLLVQIFLLLFAPLTLLSRTVPAPRPAVTLSRWTYALFVIYFVGIIVALVRYDPAMAFTMSGRFQGVAGVPLSVLMAGYRFFVLATLVLAFVIPLRYYVDRALMARALAVCWFFTVFLAVAGVVNYLGLADLRFEVTTVIMDRDIDTGLQDVLLGFRRPAHGSMLTFGIFLSFALTLVTRSQLLKAAVWLSAPLLMVALLLSWSRASVLATVVAVISLLITLGGRRAMRGLLMVIFAAVVFAIVMTTCEAVAERMSFFRTAQADASIQGRLSTWGDVLRYLARRPDVLITGAGFQNFSYSLKSAEQAVTLIAAHNSYLHVLAETGIIGFTVFLGWIVAMFRWLVSWRRQAVDANERAMAGVFASVLLGLLVSAITQETLVPAPSMLGWVLHFYLILGLWVSWYRSEMWARNQ